MIKKRSKEDNYYSNLQEKTIARIIELSGNIWTDHNVHDPGITIADYTNYGLYDIYYRQQFSFENYLFKNFSTADYSDKGLLTREKLNSSIASDSKDIFVGKIVTEQDYEEFFSEYFKDKIVSLEVYFNQATKKYDFFLKLEAYRNADFENSLLLEVKKLYHSNRNLGENIGDIMFHSVDQLPDKSAYNLHKYRRKGSESFLAFKTSNKKESEKVFTAKYQTIQYDFPAVYGISERGIPNHEATDYTAKVMQLKGYLLHFDYLMANHLNQMSATSQLLDLRASVPKNSVTDVDLLQIDEIIDENNRTIVDQNFQDDQFFKLQKYRYLNVLDAIYDENTLRLFNQNDLENLNAQRAELLCKIPYLNRDSFRGADISIPNSISSIQEILEIIIALRFPHQAPFHCKGIRILRDAVFQERYNSLLMVGETSTYENIPERKGEAIYNEETTLQKMKSMLTLIWHSVIPEGMLEYGLDINNYRLKRIGDYYTLVYIAPGHQMTIGMSLLCSDKVALTEVTFLFIDFLQSMKSVDYQQRFYFIEHNLLEGARHKDVISIVFDQDLGGDQDDTFDMKAFLGEFFEERLPMHLSFKLHGIALKDLENFHFIYSKWRLAMTNNNVQEIQNQGKALDFFIGFS